MRSVGVRDLKNRLSEYLRMVRHGEDLLVTDRGEVVAELRPVGRAKSSGANPLLEDLARRGAIRLGAANDRSLYPALDKLMEHELVVRLLDDERSER